MITSVLIAALLAVPGDVERPVLKTRLRSVALFKNGYAFFIREGPCPPVTSIDLAPLPIAVHGTFWIAADPQRLRVVEAIGSRESVTESAPALDMDELLHANVGNEVILGLDPPLRTKILRIFDPPPAEAGAQPQYPYNRGGLVIVETPTGEIALPRSFSGRVESVGGPLADPSRRPASSFGCA